MIKIEKNTKIGLFWCIVALLLTLFLFICIAVKHIDVAPIGPEGSSVGLSSLNGAIRDLIGTNTLFYSISEYLGYLSFAAVGFFAILGIIQLICKRSLKKVDIEILLLAALYVLMALLYVLFELVVVNYRPILIDGVLEASFPSSHTMLAVTVLGSAIYLFGCYSKQHKLYIIPLCACAVALPFAVFFRLASGVHWFSDILAGIFLGGTMVFAYITLCVTIKKDC